MVAWDIRAAEAMGVVRKAAGSAQGYEADIKGVETSLSSLGGALTHSQRVQQAIADYSENVIAKHVALATGHTSSAIQGTAAAVRHYDAGQLEMAATAQQNAAQADYPEDMPGRGGGSTAATATRGAR